MKQKSMLELAKGVFTFKTAKNMAVTLALFLPIITILTIQRLKFGKELFIRVR